MVTRLRRISGCGSCSDQDVRGWTSRSTTCTCIQQSLHPSLLSLTLPFPPQLRFDNGSLSITVQLHGSTSLLIKCSSRRGVQLNHTSDDGGIVFVTTPGWRYISHTQLITPCECWTWAPVHLWFGSITSMLTDHPSSRDSPKPNLIPTTGNMVWTSPPMEALSSTCKTRGTLYTVYMYMYINI